MPIYTIPGVQNSADLPTICAVDSATGLVKSKLILDSNGNLLVNASISDASGNVISSVSDGKGGIALEVNIVNGLSSNITSIFSGVQSVTTSPTALPSNVVNDSVTVTNLGPSTIYIGGSSGVTTSTGYPLPSGASQGYKVSNTNAIYVIAAATGSSVSFTGS